ncbi:MAG: prolipoprotein diacylglyceryl transferase [Gemmatimonadota bacterium]|jgi:phosphatidylglycerol:prolipoprotein diacylglycerol transferase|nr:prolipoprotein diacylglyceryl transferase [Gemmatimonadota bacterium]
MIPVAAAILEIGYHFLDPVAIPLPGPVDVRWYGLGYVFAFTVGFFVLRYLSRGGYLSLDEEGISDLIFGLILGTILGARIGYILFYDFEMFAANPARIIRLWEGGLSFHGGLIGVVLAAWWFVRKHRISLIHVLDNLALGVPFGIFAVRLANFINGELYGRITTDAVPWAMRFPTDPTALQLMGIERVYGIRERELAILEAHHSGVWDAIRDQVPLRHPSQLYEAFTEGLLLGLILWAIFLIAKRRGVRLPEGLLSGVFLTGYGIFRAFVELFRQPDAQFRDANDALGTVLGPLTMGQTLSIGVIVAGLYFLFRALRAAPAKEPVRARQP